MGANVSKRGSYSFTGKSKKSRRLEKTISLISISSRNIYEDLEENRVKRPEIKLNQIKNTAAVSEDWKEFTEDDAQREFAQNINCHENLEDSLTASDKEDQRSVENWKDVLNNGFWNSSSVPPVDNTDHKECSRILQEERASLVICNDDRAESENVEELFNRSVSSCSSFSDTEIATTNGSLRKKSDNSSDEDGDFYDAEEFYDSEIDLKSCVITANQGVIVGEVARGSDQCVVQDDGKGKSLIECELDTHPITVEVLCTNEGNIETIEGTTIDKSASSDSSGSESFVVNEEVEDKTELEVVEDRVCAECEKNSDDGDCIENETALELKGIITSINKLRSKIEDEECENNNMYQDLIKIMINVNNVKNDDFDEVILALQSIALNEINHCIKYLKSKKFR